MFKHRENLAHEPFSIDPRGSGTTMRAVSFGQEQKQQSGDRSNAPVAAAKKRPRDIRGIERFREVVYGEKGLPRFHAMIARNPIIVYPPAGIDAARRRMQKKREEAVVAPNEGRNAGKKNEHDPHPLEGDKELWAMFEERRAAEASATPNGSQVQQVTGSEAGLQSAAAAPVDTSTGEKNDREVANYHHRQLDALVGLYYEFNHLTFMKLPMKDTLQLLQRCGREAVAHCLEFEMQLRMRRETRLKELDAVAEEERELKRRQVEAQEKLLEMQLQAAETRQRGIAEEKNEEEENAKGEKSDEAGGAP
ncbi:uncharacterized protein Tco025E_06118 [Trypanosoma conorhini]|uniref:Uncharacterized protein n=1 Tax=Trypanosoma conorhini TaxID=83891 RepID=A0A422P7D2_9TRYP|nr:uncharacterized protein Tco025E_06118 [Trypanosoma conorhini]RNF13629.1 hypothetical protein Tco025E_06118 [Trypanosoma conorhini]